MLRKLLIVSAIAVAAAATIPTDASARGRHGGWHGGGHWHGGGGWHRGWHGGWHGGWRGHRGWGWYGPAFYAAPVYTCWRTVRVATRWGWQWRRVWVCR